MNRLLLAAVLCVALAGQAASASEFPTKPIRMLVPYGPGGGTDISTRIIADNARERFGQPVVVENKSGGNGVVALQEVVRSKPDGYTLVVGNLTTNVLNPLLGDPPMSFDPFKDLVPVIRLVDMPHIMIATKVNFPPDTMQAFFDYAKARPGQLNHTISGIFAYGHIDWLMLQKKTGTRLMAIPLRAGAGGGQVDIINGGVHAGITNAATVLPIIKAGKIKAIAVTSAQRLSAFPEVPTFAESGFAGFGTNTWQALYAPRGTPEAVIAALAKGFYEAVTSARARAQLEDVQYTVYPTQSPQETAAWMNAEKEKWRPILAEAKALYDAQNK